MTSLLSDLDISSGSDAAFSDSGDGVQPARTPRRSRKSETPVKPARTERCSSDSEEVVPVTSNGRVGWSKHDARPPVIIDSDEDLPPPVRRAKLDSDEDSDRGTEGTAAVKLPPLPPLGQKVVKSIIKMNGSPALSETSSNERSVRVKGSMLDDSSDEDQPAPAHRAVAGIGTDPEGSVSKDAQKGKRASEADDDDDVAVPVFRFRRKAGAGEGPRPRSPPPKHHQRGDDEFGDAADLALAQVNRAARKDVYDAEFDGPAEGAAKRRGGVRFGGVTHIPIAHVDDARKRDFGDEPPSPVDKGKGGLGEIPMVPLGKQSESSDDEGENIWMRAGAAADERARVAAEWEAVEAVQSTMPADDEPVGVIRARPVTGGTLISFIDALKAFAEDDLSAEAAQINVQPQRGFLAGVKGIFSASLNASLEHERDLVFTIAKVQLNNDKLYHIRILNSVYMKITGNKFQCPRYGSHWDVIGFQGSDPATDLRGVGMLGLLQALHFLDTFRREALEMHRLSRDSVQNFPMVLVCFQVTQIVLEMLREGAFYKECNSQSAVFPVVNLAHAAALHHFHKRWRKDHLTIKDYGRIMVPFTEEVRGHHKKIITDFHADMAAKDAIPEEFFDQRDFMPDEPPTAGGGGGGVLDSDSD